MGKVLQFKSHRQRRIEKIISTINLPSLIFIAELAECGIASLIDGEEIGKNDVYILRAEIAGRGEGCPGLDITDPDQLMKAFANVYQPPAYLDELVQLPLREPTTSINVTYSNGSAGWTRPEQPSWSTPVYDLDEMVREGAGAPKPGTGRVVCTNWGDWEK